MILKMKKTLTALILALSLLLSSCNFALPWQDVSDNSDGTSDTGKENGNPDSSCPGKNETDSGNNGFSDSVGNGGDDNNYGDKDTENVPHKDADDNGLCDSCGESVTVEINFFVLNDFHGKMSDSDTQPGADELSLYLKTLSASNPNSILLSAGDMWQGGAESNLSRGFIVTEWMNELDFEAMTLGNHEYDWGEYYIEENAKIADFPLLAINVYDRDTNTRAEYCEPSVMIERGGIQIGVIGAIGDCYSSISSDKCEDVYFKTGTALSSLVKTESERLREEGADFIVYMLHDGSNSSNSSTTISNGALSGYYDTTLSSGGYVDVVFEGHSHQSYVLCDSYGVYHMQGGGDNSGFIHAAARVNFANGNYGMIKASVISKSTYQNLPDDPYIAELFLKYADVIEKASEVLGYNSSYVNGNELEDIIAELYYELGLRVWADRYDIALGGGYLKVRSPYNLYAGEVTYSDLMMLFPFDNEIVLCSIKGYDLRKKFFYTSNSDYHISYGAYGSSIKNNIDDDATYYVIVDTYTSQYKPNKLTVIEKYDTKTFARDLLAEYIKEGGLE